MSELPRRSIDELKQRYTLEQSLDGDDLFVEGLFDKEILDNCFENKRSSRRKYVCYNIDTVDVPPDLVRTHGLTDGNKQRVITLALELERALNGGSYCYRCLVDKDLDHWFGCCSSTSRLIWTKYCSLESHFATSELLEQILIKVTKTRITNWRVFISSFFATLRNLYAMRLADRELKLALTSFGFERCLSLIDNSIVFDSDKYIAKLLLHNKKKADCNVFIETYKKWMERLIDDQRYYMHGHDFTNLIVWSIGKFKGIKAFVSEVAVQRLFLTISINKDVGLLEILFAT